MWNSSELPLKPTSQNRSNQTHRTPAATEIQWRDLVPLTPWEKFVEATLPLPWLALSLYLYHSGHWIAGAFASFYFFLTGLRQSHGAQHYTLGIRRFWQNLILFVLSVLMLGSMHAVQVSHMHHHRHCLDENDTEGATARLPWWKAILIGPIFPVRLHRTAWQIGSRAQKSWIVAEIVAFAIAGVIGLFIPGPLRFHFSAMLIGECLTGFFAVWTVHHHCDPRLFARTQRGRWINFLSYNMFLHTEHHLFPIVPTCHLHRLGPRLDAAAPQFASKQVLSAASATRGERSRRQRELVLKTVPAARPSQANKRREEAS
jgi:fatty acid desaturase